MAARFSGSTTYLIRTASVPGATPLMVTLRLYLVSDRNASGVVYDVVNAGGTVYQDVRLASNGTTLDLRTSGGSAAGPDLTVGQWYHLGTVRDGASHTLYVDGVAVATLTSAISLTPAGILIGSNTVAWVNARVADLGFWSVAGDATAVAAEAASYGTPARTADLWGYYPLASDANDTSGNGRHLTVNGAVTWEAGPAQALAPAAISSAATVHGPTIAAAGGGAQTILPAAIDGAAAAHAPTVAAGPVVLAPDAVTGVTAVHAPTVAAGAATIAPDAVTGSAAVHAPVVGAGAVSLEPDAIGSAAQVFAPTVQALGGIAPDAIGSGAVVHGPTLSAGAVTVAPDAVTEVTAVHALTVNAGAVTLAPDAPGGAAVVHGVVVVGVGSFVPDAIGAGAQVFAPAVQAGPVAIAPDAISSTAAVYAPFVGDGTGQGIGPDAITSAAQVFAVLVTAVAAGRIQRISAEDRRFAVAVEGRTLAVNFESRTSTVQGE